MKKTFFILLLLISLNVFSINLKGVVKNKATKETIVGANIILNDNIGTITDIYGNFEIKNLKSGSYKLKVSFISYNSYQEVIEINNDMNLNIYLDEINIVIDGVTIFANKKTDTELSTIMAIKSNNIMSIGVSNQIISKTQDKDASEVVKRLSGVSIIDNKYIIVRGLNERYNNVYLNNITSPSFDSDKKSFSFDILPSSVIDNILIHKTSAPEFSSSFSGGNIYITTKETDSIFTKITFGSSYNPNTTFKDFFYYKGGKYDFLGFDDGIRSIPKNAPNSLKEYYLFDENYKQNQEKLINVSKEFNNDWNLYKKTSIPDIKFSFDISRKYNLKKLKILNFNSFIYSNTSQFLQIDRKNYQVFNFIENKSVLDFDFNENRYDNVSKVGLISNFTFNHKKFQLHFKNFFNNVGLMRTTLRDGVEYYSNQYLKSFEYKFSRRTIYSSQLIFKINDFNSTLGYSKTIKSEPDLRRLTTIKNIDPLSLNYNQYSLAIGYSASPKYAGRIYTDLNEDIFSSTSDYTKKINNLEFKIGYYSEFKQRQFNNRLLGYIQSSQHFNLDLYQSPDKIFDITNINNFNGIKLDETTNPSDSYIANNFSNSVFLSMKLPMNKLKVYAGIRIESNNSTLNSYEANGLFPIIIKHDTINFFSSINLTYDVNKDNLLRFSYGKTINRPEFRELAPLVFYDFEYNASFSGNPDLKNCYIHNFDLKYEKYIKTKDYFNFSIFYKSFINPIEVKYINAGSGLQYGYQNAERSYVYGSEVEFRKEFIKNLSFNVNAAITKSNVIFKNNIDNRPMQGQSPYIINFGIYYEKNKIKTNLLYNVIGKRIMAVGQPMQVTQENIPDVYEMPFNSLDFSLNYEIKKISYKIGVQNLLNQDVTYVQSIKNEDKEISQVNLKYNKGIQFNFSISYNF
jgi:hypothetical protein